MKKLFSGHAYGHGGFPLLYRYDKELSEEQKALMDKFLIKAPSIKSLQGDEGAELPTDKLVELGYLLVDVEPTQAEFDNGSAKAIVIATPRRRAVAIASSFDSLVADDSHFDGDIGWYSYFDFLIAHKSYDECIKYIRFIRAVEEVLVADETIIAIYAGHGINNDEDAFIPELSVPQALEAIVVTNKRVLSFYEHDQFNMRDAGYCFLDEYDHSELRKVDLNMMTLPACENDEEPDKILCLAEVIIREKGTQRNTNIPIYFDRYFVARDLPGGVDEDEMVDIIEGSFTIQEATDNVFLYY